MDQSAGFNDDPPVFLKLNMENMSLIVDKMIYHHRFSINVVSMMFVNRCNLKFDGTDIVSMPTIPLLLS